MVLSVVGDRCICNMAGMLVVVASGCHQRSRCNLASGQYFVVLCDQKKHPLPPHFMLGSNTSGISDAYAVLEFHQHST